MVATPKARLTEAQRRKLSFRFRHMGRTDEKRAFAKEVGISDTSLFRAMAGQEMSDFIIKKIVAKI